MRGEVVSCCLSALRRCSLGVNCGFPLFTSLWFCGGSSMKGYNLLHVGLFAARILLLRLKKQFCTKNNATLEDTHLICSTQTAEASYETSIHAIHAMFP